MYKHIIFMLLILWSNTFLAQGPGSGINSTALNIEIITPTDAHICGTSTLYLNITNNHPSQCVKITNATIDLHPGPLDAVLLEGLGPNAPPGVFIASGVGSSQLVLGFNQMLLPQTTIQVPLKVRYDCDLFERKDQLPAFQIGATAQWDLVQCASQQISLSGQVFQTTSSPYQVNYSFISPAFNLQGIGVVPETPFSVSIPLEVTGNFCDSDFFVRLKGLESCLDISEATYGFGGNNELSVPQIQGDEIWLPVQAEAFQLDPFCSSNYPGGMGELVLQIKNLRLRCGCLLANSSALWQVGVSTCSQGALPADCFNAAGYPLPQTESSIAVEGRTPGLAEVALVNLGESNPFRVCAGQNKLIFRVSNQSVQTGAYDVHLNLSVLDGYTISEIKISDMPWPFTIVNGQVSLSFSQNVETGIGLSDLNNDGYYEEISPLTGFLVEVTYSKRPPTCPFGSGAACEGNCGDVPAGAINVVKASATWNNVCSSLNPPASSALEYNVAFNKYRMNVKYDDFPITEGEFRRINVNLGVGSVAGLEGYLDNGPIRQYICVTSNMPTGQVQFRNLSYGSLFLEGPFDLTDIGEAIQGVLGGGNLSFDVVVLYCNEQTPRLMLINVQTGFYLDNCPECFYPMACDEARLIPPCYNNQMLEACDVLEPNFTVVNSVYSGTSTVPPLQLNAYPCDYLIATLHNSPVLQTQNGPLLIGFAVATDRLPYLQLPTTFEGTVYQNTPGAAPLELNFSGQRQLAFFDPMTFIYFQSDESPLTQGSSISGNLYIKMSGAFAEYFQKIEFFRLFVGYIDDGTPKFCMEDHSLYALDVDYQLSNTRETDCLEGSRIRVDVIKVGGELRGFGPDFPNIYRPPVWIGGPRLSNILLPGGQVMANVDDSNPNFMVTYIGNDPNGNAPLFDNPLVINAQSLAQPSGLEEEGDVVQTLYVRYRDNCAGDIPAKIDLDITRRPDTRDNCPETTHHTLLSSEMPHQAAELPLIQTTFLPENQSVIHVDLNRISIRTRTTNTANVTADIAWMQLSYNPGKLKLIKIHDEGVDFDAPQQFDNGTREIVWIKYNHLIAGQSKDNQFDFILLEGACSMDAELRLEGYHTCFPFVVTYPAHPATDPEHCADSYDLLRLKPMDSKLNLSARRCVQANDVCDKVYVSILLDNLSGQGSTDQVRIALDIPPGLTLTNAYFRNSFAQHCTAVTEPADINALTGAGWEIPSIYLPGIQSGKDDALRYFYLYLELEVGCRRDPAFNALTIRASGITPCGTELVRTNTVTNLFKVPDFSNVSVNLQAQVLEYNCTSNRGTLAVQIQQLVNWPGGAGTITLSSPQGVTFTPSVLQFTENGPNYFVVDVQNTNGTCFFEMNASVDFCKEYNCGSNYGSSCFACTKVGQLYYSYPQTTGSLSISQEICLANPEDMTTMIAKFPFPSNLIGAAYQGYVFCDKNGNRIFDAGDVMLEGNIQGTFAGANPQGSYAAYIPIKNGKLLGCDGDIVFTLLKVNAECICLPPVSTSFCCQCPEWNYTRSIIEGTVTIDPRNNATGVRPGCVEVYIDNEFVDYYFTYPFSFELNGGEKVCLIFRKVVPRPCTPLSCPFREGCDANCCTEDCFEISRLGERNSATPDTGFTAEIQPNPFQDHVNLWVRGLSPNQPWSMEILNATGNTLLVQPQTGTATGTAQISIPVEDLPAGIYFLRIAAESHHQVLKLIKQ